MEKLKFELGKYYQHSGGLKLHICGLMDSIGHGICFVAEDNNYVYQSAGVDEINAKHWHEITKEQFINNETVKGKSVNSN